ncbi:MAG: phosphoribosylglycinamide formyltransferase [Sphaerochaetaceae bacterium]|nr:phosphoribosylglycinamide formyltransferase [Sphaerochaetaceae bacterium]
MLTARPKRNIAVLVSGGGTNLQALIDAQTAGRLSAGRIAVVVSDTPKAYALERAEKAGIEGVTVSKKDYATKIEFEQELNQILESRGTDLIVLAGFLSILSADFVAKYPRKIINVHPSLIPSFCGKGFYGLKVHEAALAKGVKISGATVHFVNEIPDGGEIILQKAVDVLDDDTPQSLQERIMREAEWQLLWQAAEKVCREMND